MPKDEEKIAVIAKEILRDYDRYYRTVYLLIGMMEYLNSNEQLDFRLISCSRKMRAIRKEDKKELEPKPDIILQNKANNKGLLVEIKTSYPETDVLLESALKKDIKQLAAFDCIVRNWDTDNKTMSDFGIVLMPYHEAASRRATKSLIDKISKKEIVFEHPFTIWFWSIDISMKKKEIMQIFHSEFNKGVGWELGKKVEDNIIEIDLENLFVDWDEERYRFGRDPPANCVYTIVQIYNIMGPMLRKGQDNKIICTIDEVMALAETYLPAWIPDDGKKSQLKRDWVRDALEMLVKIGLAQRYADGITYEWIEPKNVKDYQNEVINRVAELLINDYGVLTPKNDKQEASVLPDYFDDMLAK